LEFVKMLQESTWLDQASIKAAIDKVKTTWLQIQVVNIDIINNFIL
jgi:hypothetical protein